MFVVFFKKIIQNGGRSPTRVRSPARKIRSDRAQDTAVLLR